jgi:YaaC-like Protein
MPPLPTARIPQGFRDYTFDRRIKRELSTSAPIAEEIFSALEFYSEIDEVGLKFLKTNAGCNEADSKIIYPKFQAFVRQAKTFFIPAESLHHRARPLFYYYAFLNLAKALLCVKNPRLFLSSDKFNHGISEIHAGTKFSDEFVEVSNKGVFVELYTALTELKLPKNTRLNIQEMLKYSTDICFDYETKIGDLNIARGKCKMCFDVESKNSWPLIAMLGFTELEIKSPKAFVQFHSMFEEVKVEWQIGERLFGLMRSSLGGWRFFQSRKIYPFTDEGKKLFFSDFDAVLNKYFESSVYKEPIDFHLSLPIGSNFEYPWNEFLASYVVYFYLGSLVRYHPAYLESLLRTRESWKLESFTKSASQTILRQALAYIVNEIYVFESR